MSSSGTNTSNKPQITNTTLNRPLSANLTRKKQSLPNRLRKDLDSSGEGLKLGVSVGGRELESEQKSFDNTSGGAHKSAFDKKAESFSIE